MNIIVGASGQVGSQILKNLILLEQPVTAVVRDSKSIYDKTVVIKTADLLNQHEVIEAFKGGTTVFLLTTENPGSENIIEDTKIIIDNYIKAIEENQIQRVFGLSCGGAHVNQDTGNILMSRLLEESLNKIKAEVMIILPSYYFSNWLGFIEQAKESNSIISFFPENFKCHMQSPIIVANFIAHKISEPHSNEKNKEVFELSSGKKYSAKDVAEISGEILDKEISVQEIDRKEWINSLEEFGFTKNAASNLAKMTAALVDEVAGFENPNKITELPTSLKEYLKTNLSKPTYS